MATPFDLNSAATAEQQALCLLTQLSKLLAVNPDASSEGVQLNRTLTRNNQLTAKLSLPLVLSHRSDGGLDVFAREVLGVSPFSDSILTFNNEPLTFVNGQTLEF